MSPSPQSDPTLEITIQTTRGSRNFAFAKTTKISEVIQTVVEAFGFAPGDEFQLVFSSDPSQPLQPERPLVSYGIEDGTVLVLTSIGSGV
jgi:hypothetical protein